MLLHIFLSGAYGFWCRSRTITFGHYPRILCDAHSQTCKNSAVCVQWKFWPHFLNMAYVTKHTEICITDSIYQHVDKDMCSSGSGTGANDRILSRWTMYATQHSWIYYSFRPTGLILSTNSRLSILYICFSHWLYFTKMILLKVLQNLMQIFYNY
jgi:hypothetical protein